MAGYWCDVGTLLQYRLAHQDVLHGLVRLYTPGVEVPGSDQPVILGEGATVEPGAVLQGRIMVGPGCHIASGARLLGDVVLGAGVQIAEGATVESSVLWSGASVGQGASVSQSVIGQDSRVEPGAAVGEGSVLSDTCVVQAWTELAAGSILRPGEVFGR
jgi:mannose-1-phosphate guanylyltransferase/phosphomannomutase